jgi:hypothetical protein
LAAATWEGVGDPLEVVLDVVVLVGGAPPLAAVVVVGGADSVVVPAEVVVVALAVGAVAVVVEDVAVVVAAWVGVDVLVSVVEAMLAFPPQPAMPRASATMMAIAGLFIGSS